MNLARRWNEGTKVALLLGLLIDAEYASCWDDFDLNRLNYQKFTETHIVSEIFLNSMTFVDLFISVLLQTWHRKWR